jgi:sporulation protein YlmC with PRC-barrel domain
MKRFAALMAILTIGICVVATAAPPDNRPTTTRAQAGKLDDVTSGSNIRASQLIGIDIQNQEGKSIGSVNDIVIDAESGKIRYAAVSYGGFLGLGDRLFAVPWGAFHCKAGDEKGQYNLVLNATEQQLKTASGFDQDNWPNFADRSFTSQLDKHYGVEYQADRRRGGVDVKVGPGGVDVDVNTNRRDRDRRNRNQ